MLPTDASPSLTRNDGVRRLFVPGYERDHPSLQNGLFSFTKLPQGNKTEEELVLAVFQYVEHLVSLATPAKFLFMVSGYNEPEIQALDGTPPRAKMTQQRQRRFQHLAKNRFAREKVEVEKVWRDLCEGSGGGRISAREGILGRFLGRY